MPAMHCTVVRNKRHNRTFESYICPGGLIEKTRGDVTWPLERLAESQMITDDFNFCS